jgi:hypothetical protein
MSEIIIIAVTFLVGGAVAWRLTDFLILDRRPKGRGKH